MGRFLVTLAAGAVVFATSAAGSWFLQQSQQPEAAEMETEVPVVEPITPTTPVTAADEMEAAVEDERLPVAVRPRPMSVEEILRHGMALKQREERILKREQELDQQDSELRIMLTDLASEQSDVEVLHAQVKEQAELLKGLVDEVQAARRQLADDRKAAVTDLEQIENARIEVDADQSDNLKRLSRWIQGMEAKKAAQLLRELAEDGNSDMAVKLMENLEDRDASKILSEIDDPTLVIDLAEKFKNLKRKKKPAKRR